MSYNQVPFADPHDRQQTSKKSNPSFSSFFYWPITSVLLNVVCIILLFISKEPSCNNNSTPNILQQPLDDFTSFSPSSIPTAKALESSPLCYDLRTLSEDFFISTTEFIPSILPNRTRVSIPPDPTPPPGKPGRCYKHWGHMVEYGVTSTIHGLAKPRMIAFMNRGGWELPMLKRYCSGFNCFFEPSSFCDPGQKEKKYKIKSYDGQDFREGHGPLVPENQKFFPWVSWIMGKIVVLTEALSQRLEKLKNEMNWPADARVLGVHVRHSDACITHDWENRTCTPWKGHVPYIDKMIDAYDFKYVYLATDDVNVISEAIADFENRPVKLMVRDRTSLDATATLVRHEEAKETTIEGVFNEFKKIDSSFGRDVFEDVLMDVELLAACEALVGKFSSNIDRLALELMTARSPEGYCLKPFISMDHPWCFNWGFPSQSPNINSLC